MTFTGFGTPVPGVSYLRCRIANTASQVTNPTGAATSGEVEDYKVTIIGLDYGDAPDTGIGVAQGNYNTKANDNGPNHVIVGGLSLGSIPPDADPGTLQDIDASADNADNVDDEDGVAVLPEVTVGSASVALTVQVINATASNATVACWIDFNRDGVFGANERSLGDCHPGHRREVCRPDLQRLSYTRGRRQLSALPYCQRGRRGCERDRRRGQRRGGGLHGHHRRTG